MAGSLSMRRCPQDGSPRAIARNRALTKIPVDGRPGALRVEMYVPAASRRPRQHRVSVPDRFLQFTIEHHWILELANAEVWYQTVLSFCAEHVLGHEPETSALL